MVKNFRRYLYSFWSNSRTWQTHRQTDGHRVTAYTALMHMHRAVKTNKDIFEFFSPLGSQAILVFPYQTGWRYSDGNPPPPSNGFIEFRWGIGRNHDSGLIAGYRRLLDVRSAKNIYRRRSWVYDTVGHAPLAIDRLLDVQTTKWQKQLPTTMQCRSHSCRRTIECLFVTACSMDQYAEEKRTEKNSIVRSGISEAQQL